MFRLALDDEVARLTLDRPEARNAIPAAAWDSLAGRIAEVEGSAARLLVLAGAGGAFCAGADLADFPMAAGEAARFREAMRRAIDRLADLPMPTIARVEGACYGAGVALAMACDLRVAAGPARFAIPPAKIGISYPQKDVHRLVELVGPGQAARLLFTGLAIDGAEAARIGLVELCAPAADVELILAAILANGRDSLVALKRAIRLAAAGRRSDAEADRWFDALLGGEAIRAALTPGRRDRDPDRARRLEARRRK